MIYTGRYVYLALLLVGGAYVGMAHAALPAAVAVHFDTQGRPNGWVNPTSYLAILTIVGLVIPLGVVALVSFLGNHSPGLLNLPHRTERNSPPRLATGSFLVMLAAFLGGLALWIVGWFKVLRFGPAE